MNRKQRYVFLVLTNAAEGQDEAFNDWYTNQHLPDLLRIDGFVSAQRFELTAIQRLVTFPHPYRYAAIYELETDDLATTYQAMQDAADAGRMPSTGAIAHDRIGSVFIPLTDRVTREDVR
jgi:hypothetical protein